MRRIFAAFSLASLLTLLPGCASDGSLATDPTKIDPVATFQNACVYIGTADASFKAAAPALEQAGKLTPASVAKEAGIYAAAEVTCANPPANLQAAAIALVGDAAAIYLLIESPAPAADFLPPSAHAGVAARAAARLAR